MGRLARRHLQRVRVSRAPQHEHGPHPGHVAPHGARLLHTGGRRRRVSTRSRTTPSCPRGGHSSSPSGRARPAERPRERRAFTWARPRRTRTSWERSGIPWRRAKRKYLRILILGLDTRGGVARVESSVDLRADRDVMGRDLPQVPVKGLRASRARACIYMISCSNAADRTRPRLLFRESDFLALPPRLPVDVELEHAVGVAERLPAARSAVRPPSCRRGTPPERTPRAASPNQRPRNPNHTPAA